jgi:hypothetical protein
MKFTRTALLFAASGVILAAVPATAASAQTAAGRVPVYCGKVGKGETTAWVSCHGRGYARLEYKCKTFAGGIHSGHTSWKKMKAKKNTKIVARCNNWKDMHSASVVVKRLGS